MNCQSAPDAVGHYDPISAGILRQAAQETAVLPYNDADAVEAYVKSHAGQVAAIIVEPIAHNVGAMRATDEFLRGLRRIATENGVVLIFDEVITGFRHALGGYQSICGVTPDLATFGKAAAAGYPVGLVAGRRDLLERAGRTGTDAVFMGGTFNGTPSTLAAILATIEELSRPDTYRTLFELGGYLRHELDGIVARVGLPAQGAGYGSVWLLYFFEGPYARYEDLLRNDDALDAAFRRELVAHRYIFQPLPMKRMYVCAAHDKAILDRALDVMESSLRKLAATRVRPAHATA
jgi:glutamate-1-semialdehyde 2,1-aminomutase